MAAYFEAAPGCGSPCLMSLRYAKVWSVLAGALIGKHKFTSREVARRAGVDVDTAWMFWRALGFARVSSNERAFTEKDVAMLKAGVEVLEREDTDAQVVLQIVRASGQSLSRMAEVQAVPIAQDIRAAMRSKNTSDAQAADRIVEASETLLSTIEPFLTYAWRRHLLAAVAQIAATDVVDISESRELAIGFADLVGFTAVSQELSNREIAATVERLEQIAYDHIPEHGGRVIKMIGDEVLFSCASAASAAQIALDLVEACAAESAIPDIRVGLAFGPTLAWEGDVFGPTVNLASRLVNVARPGTVLVSEQLAEMLLEVDGVVVRELPRVRPKGIGKMRPRVIRRS